MGAEYTVLIDDFSRSDLVSQFGTPWRGVSDRVMGGVSEACIRRELHDGQYCLRLTGAVSLENNGGFVQAALDLSADGEVIDARAQSGIRMTVMGNGEEYSLRLRTPDNLRSWQSYRTEFMAPTAWRTIELPFERFIPHRLETPLDISRLKRIGLLAIGREFSSDLMVSEISFYS